MVDVERAVVERFLAHTVRAETGCLLWTAARSEKGYGRFAHPRERLGLAHRYAHEFFIGPIPDGYQVDHLCKNPSCVEPTHLEAVPPAVNNARSDSPTALNARKTHCPAGHEYDEANTYVDRRGHRSCRACKRKVNEVYNPLRKPLTLNQRARKTELQRARRAELRAALTEEA